MINLVDEILYDYLDKIITQKQVYEYLLNYGYSKKQIKDFIKEKDKLWWLSSHGHSSWDDHFYCKDCFRRLFKLLPEKIKLTFAGYKGKEKK